MLLFLTLFSLILTPGHSYQSKSIFLLAGQSNMAGRGGVTGNKWDGVIPPSCQPNPSVLRLDAELRWEEAQEPLHADIELNRTCGIGPGMPFANAIREMDPLIGVVGLVPCAIGGTNISEWRRGGRWYDQLVKRGKVGVREGGTIRGVLWYQGESDTVTRVDAEEYKVNLQRFVMNLRSDLQSPMLPIIQVALASGQGPYIEIVREAQLGLHLPNVRCVDAKGLELEPDELHPTTLSQVLLGQMLAQEFIKTLQRPMAIFHNTAPISISHYFQCLFILLICSIMLWVL